MATPKVVLLWTNGDGVRPVLEDYKAAAAVTPGEILELSSGELQPGEGDVPLVRVAVENPAGDIYDNTASIDTDYADGDTLRYVVPQRGDRAYCWLKSGDNVAAGAKLEVASTGQFTALDTGTLVALAREAVNASAAAKRIIVEFV